MYIAEDMQGVPDIKAHYMCLFNEIPPAKEHKNIG